MKIVYIRVELCPLVWRSYEDRVQSYKEAWERIHTTEHDHVPDRNETERDYLDLLNSCSVVAKVVYVGK